MPVFVSYFITATLILITSLGASAERSDIEEYLNSIQGLTFEKQKGAPMGYEYYHLKFEQPVDHENPEMESFEQRIVLLHRSSEAPTVLITNGYMTSMRPNRNPLTSVLNANQVKVEYRYFAESTPASRDRTYLNIKQAASDHHRIVQALRPFYNKKWVSTGASKGGMSALYHRRFYPEDVDGTVANVAPLSFARKDTRYNAFLDQVGNASCRAAMKSYQRSMLLDRKSMEERIRGYASKRGIQYSLPISDILDSAVSEVYFSFWQYQTLRDCTSIPDKNASEYDRFQFLVNTRLLSFLGKEDLSRFETYFYQAETQLGYPAYYTAHLDDLLQSDVSDLYSLYPHWPTDLEFDSEAMVDIGNWVKDNSENVMLIYGSIDPWTAGAFEIENSERRGTHSFMVKNGNHGVNILSLSINDRVRADQLLEDWTDTPVRNVVLPASLLSNETLFDDDLVFRRF